VELAEEHPPPRTRKFLLTGGRTRYSMGHGRQTLGSYEGGLRLAVFPLDARKRGITAASVVLEVVRDHGPVTPEGFDLGKVAFWCREDRPWPGAFSHHLLERPDVRPRRAPAVVAHAIETENCRQAGRSRLGRRGDARMHVLAFWAAVVERRAHRQDARAIGRLPPEGRGGQILLVRPRPEKDIVIEPALLEELRQRASMPERVYVVPDGRAPSEAVHEVALSVEGVARERLSARDVTVRLEPPAVHQCPASALHRTLNATEERRVALLGPLEGDRAAGSEDVAVELVDQLQGSAVSGQDLSPALAHWPEPDGVDVGVPDHVHSQ